MENLMCLKKKKLYLLESIMNCLNKFNLLSELFNS